MKVFKFGGASVKNATGVQNVASIIQSAYKNNLLVVVSAMGKTTDLLEKIVTLHHCKQAYEKELRELKAYHAQITAALFHNKHGVANEIEKIMAELSAALTLSDDVDLVYDQVVSTGEILSTLILHHYLIDQGVSSRWIDARQFIATDNSFREGKVDWQKSSDQIQQLIPVLETNVVVTQGFIGQSPEGLTTTLGREGSDYSAAIFASCLHASDVTIWKDVPGVMSADPRRFPQALVFDELPFREAAEMTYYGASVIHPKTIKPLANRNIPLLVKNFDDPSLPGTIIHECKVDNLPPLIVFKENQCLISCKVTDYTFISEQQLSNIFITLSELDIKINVMQNSAISFSFCTDFRESKVMKLINRLQQNFEVYYNLGLTLITIKNYDAAVFDAYRKKEGVILEQSSRSTLQVLVKKF
ncbi:MAG: aspartate kinase [Cyclobacteriaceae bacterium]|nr:aspartate kinase [Cyclobacteriaceae bacterium]